MSFRTQSPSICILTGSSFNCWSRKCQRLSLQTVNPIGLAAVRVLAKPPFVLKQRKRHCEMRGPALGAWPER